MMEGFLFLRVVWIFYSGQVKTVEKGEKRKGGDRE